MRTSGSQGGGAEIYDDWRRGVKTTKERRVVSVIEAGRILGLGRQGAYNAVARGEIPVLRFGRRILVPVPALERLLENGSGTVEGD